jgi:voltage-gated potassium channel
VLIVVAVKKLLKIFGKSNAGVLFLATGLVIALGTFGGYFAENPVNPQFKNIGDSFWWTIVTMSTVGYGDKVPVTVAGRIIGGIGMIGGPLLLVSLVGTIGVAFYSRWMKGVKGMAQVTKKGHIIICGWDKKAEDIVRELGASLLRDLPVVIIDNAIESKPVEDNRVSFVKGNASELSTLNKANIAGAKYAIIIAEGNTPAADQKTVLTVLAIKKTNPSVITCAELIDANNEEHLNHAGCDIIINASILSSRLLAMSLQNPSVNAIIKELVSQYGNDIFRVPVPPEYAGRGFLATFSELKESHGIIVIGLERDGKTMVNPRSAEILKTGDSLLVISEESPSL